MRIAHSTLLCHDDDAESHPTSELSTNLKSKVIEQFPQFPLFPLYN